MEILTSELVAALAALYDEMEEAYDRVAKELSFSCQGCPDNCCDSYFEHHTYLEWAYLWHGVPAARQQELTSRAAEWVVAAEQALAAGERPQLMCPVNDNGLCSLYRHRLMICRLHGVPSAMVRPDGKRFQFPGCFRCQELVGEESAAGPRVDRTEFYRRLVALEQEFLGHRRNYLPRVKMTIAQMLVKGPPRL